MNEHILICTKSDFIFDTCLLLQIFGTTSENDESVLSSVNSEEEFQLLVSESGLTQLLTVNIFLSIYIFLC